MSETGGAFEMQHQEIVFRLAGQSFTFDPPDGRPAESPVPIVQVHEGGRGVAAATGACTVDPVATTLSGDVPAGSTAIRVASVDGIVPGGRYLMTKPDRDREWIQVVAIRDSKLVLKHPLIHRYAGAATIIGCRISIGVDPAWVAASAHLSDAPGPDRGLARYVLRWTYTIDGFEVSAISFADLVSCRAEQVVTPADVDERFPGWIARLPPEGRANKGADFIAEAFRVVRLEAIGDAHAQRRIRDTQILRELVNVRADVIRLEHDVMYGERGAAELAIAEKRYRACHARLVELPEVGASVRETLKVPLAKPKRRTSEPYVPRRIPKLTKL